MNSIHYLTVSVCALLSSAVPLAAQTTQPGARTNLYHVHFAKAALGKAGPLGDYFKTAPTDAAMPGHRIVLRHEDGAAWDYVVIEHLGAKTTVEATATPVPANFRDLSEWHNDTFVNGPAWPEFARALGLSDAAKTADSVYVVSVYRAAPGHRDQLEKVLTAPPGSGDTSVGNIVMQHIEGGPWNYLSIVRYSSWPDLAKNEANDRQQMSKGSSQWSQLRDHAIFHEDTMTGRIAP